MLALTTLVLEVMDRDVDEEGYSALFEQLYIMMLCLPILVLRVPCKLSRKQGAAMILERCARFLRGEWASLYANASCEVERANTRNREQDDGGAAGRQRRLLDRVNDEARKLNLARAMGLLRSAGREDGGLASGPIEEIMKTLEELHPAHPICEQGREVPSFPLQSRPGGDAEDMYDVVTGPWLVRQIRASKRGGAVDQFGWDTREMWGPLIEDADLMQDMSKAFFRPLAEGYLPPSIRDIMAGGRLVALSKRPKKGIRPICIGNAWRRLLGRGLLKEVNKTIVDFLQNSNPNVIQFIGTKDGAANMFHLVAAMEEEARTLNAQAGPAVQAHGPFVVVALDAKNAFNSLKREAIWRFFQTHLGGAGDSVEQRQAWALLWKYVEAHYGVEGRLRYHHGGVTHFLRSLGGVHQGDPLGSVLYALAVHRHLVAVANKYRSLPVRVVAYADNVFLLAHQRQALEAAGELCGSLQGVGIEVNQAESMVFCPGGGGCNPRVNLVRGDAVVLSQGGAEISLPIAKDGLKVLGGAVGSESFCSEVFGRNVAKIVQDVEHLELVDSLHLRSKLAVYCCNTRISYFLRLASLRTSSAWTVKYDKAFECVFRRVLHFPFDSQDPLVSPSYDNALEQLRLPITKGGFGLASAEVTAPGGLYSAVVGFACWHAQ